MNWHAALELASFAVTVVGLPFAIWVFMAQERAERENEEEEAYLHLADAYNDFLKVLLANSELQLRTATSLPFLLRGEGPDFQRHIQRVAQEETGRAVLGSA